jgi:hypothetical protein
MVIVYLIEFITFVIFFASIDKNKARKTDGDPANTIKSDAYKRRNRLIK